MKQVNNVLPGTLQLCNNFVFCNLPLFHRFLIDLRIFEDSKSTEGEDFPICFLACLSFHRSFFIPQPNPVLSFLTSTPCLIHSMMKFGEKLSRMKNLSVISLNRNSGKLCTLDCHYWVRNLSQT